MCCFGLNKTFCIKNLPYMKYKKFLDPDSLPLPEPQYSTKRCVITLVNTTDTYTQPFCKYNNHNHFILICQIKQK